MRSALLMIHMSWCFMTNITRPSTAIASTSNWTDGNAYCSSMCGALFKTILLALCSICMPSPGLSAATNLCVDPNIIDGWYDGDSIDIANNVWTDKSVNNNDGNIGVSTGIGVSDGTTETHELFTHFNRIAVYGATTTQIEFNVDLHPTTHTVIHYCKYRDSGTKQRILQATMEDSVFGFWGGLSGQAYEYSAFITDGVTDHFGSEWVLSAQQRDLYRGNGIDLTVNPTGTFQVTQTLDINKGFKPEKSSDWACTEIIIINQKIPLDDIICIENYLLEKYSHNPLQSCVDPSIIDGWYDGDSIDIAGNVWKDKSGHAEHGTIGVSTGIGVSDGTTQAHELFTYLGQIAVYGTTATQISFPADLHPTDHTVFNYCKYRDSGTKQRILQATME
eukprot:515727_1